MQEHEVPWQYYPHVCEDPSTRAFVVSQVKRQKRPKTVDAYARNLEDLIRAFADFGFTNLVEATPDQLETYIESSFYKVTSQPGEKLSVNTIKQRIVTARLFYDFCIYRGYRKDTLNPLPRGDLGYGGTSPKRGVISQKPYLPWIPSDSEWERLITYIA